MPWAAAATSLLSLSLENTRTEFSEKAQIGYGLDGDEAERALDFEAVRGSYEGNPVIRNLNEQKRDVEKRLARLEKMAGRFV